MTIDWRERADLRRPLSLAVAAVCGLAAVGCGYLTREEAKEAVEEAQLFSEAATLIGNTVEITENFTIGGAVSDAAANLGEFYASQLPCAETTLAANTLLVEYGVNGDDCTHKGMTFSGTHEVTISLSDEEEVVVDHVWTDLDNGKIKVSGTAQVTWKGGDDPSRRVVHDLLWTRLTDGREAQGTGDRVQEPLDGDLSEGYTVTGDAQWRGESGTWELRIKGGEIRWRDPVPQAGIYELETPFDQDLTLEFRRSDTQTIDVIAQSGPREFEFSVDTPL